MSRKGHYPGGSTIIRIYPTAGGRKPVKKGALSLWVKQFEAEKKAGLIKRIAPESFPAVPSVSVDVSMETPGKPNRVKKKGQKQPKSPKRFPKATKQMRERATKRFIQQAMRRANSSSDEEA